VHGVANFRHLAAKSHKWLICPTRRFPLGCGSGDRSRHADAHTRAHAHPSTNTHTQAHISAHANTQTRKRNIQTQRNAHPQSPRHANLLWLSNFCSCGRVRTTVARYMAAVAAGPSARGLSESHSTRRHGSPRRCATSPKSASAFLRTYSSRSRVHCATSASVVMLFTLVVVGWGERQCWCGIIGRWK